MHRRSLLAATGLALSSLGAGCSFSEPSTAECHLQHEIVDSPDDYGAVTDTYSYEELSDDARQVFDEAVTDGSYATADRNLEPDEFRYWDTVTVYTVTTETETYTLLTYTGEGCDRN